MKNKAKKSGVILIIVILIILNFVPRKSEKVLNNTDEKRGFSNRLSMMLENESGDYIATTAKEWPSAGYKFNSKLSKCESGGKVSWDYKNKRVKMEGSSSDKCYIYFDKIVTVDSYCEDGDNLADCIKTYGDQGYDKSSIYIHDSSLTNGAGDNSYRFAGASDYVNNFVCFGTDASTCPTDNLYRIIGVFGDQVKLIKYDYATSALLGMDGSYANNYALENSFDADSFYIGANELSTIPSYYWNSSGVNTWSISSLNTINLNNNYYNSFSNSWRGMIATTLWNVGGNSKEKIQYEIPSNTYQNEIISSTTSDNYQAKIGLVYVSDYGFTVDSSFWNIMLREYYNFAEQSWMYMGLHEWTITRGMNYAAYIINHAGMLGFNVVDAIGRAIRPAFYLKSSIKYVSGKGTKESPIRLENSEVTLADYVKSQYTGSQGANGIYLHNSSLTNGAGDNSYRYAGSNPNNFVCFGSTASTCPTDNLYRIIGVFGDQVKLIKSSIGTTSLLGTDGAYTSTENRYSWSALGSESNTWSTSLLNTTNLNENFINNIGSAWAGKISLTSWQVGGMTADNISQKTASNSYYNEIVSPSVSTIVNAKIGLMYVSDYGYATLPSGWNTILYQYANVSTDNWLKIGTDEHTITRNSSTSNMIFQINFQGNVGSGRYTLYVRPCFYLNSDVAINGEHTGSESDPIRLNI